MKKRFGIPIPEFRTDYGTLKLEALTFGALNINHSDENNLKLISAAVSANSALRDICGSYEGTIQVFITDTSIGENELAESLSKMELDGFDLNKITILEYSYFDENPANRIAAVAYV